MDLKLNKKNILITGANGYLGKALVKELKSHRSNLILIDNKNQKKKLSKGINFLFCDLNQKKSIDRLIKNLKKIKIHGIVNCAAITSDELKDFNQLNSHTSDFDKVININLKSIIYIIHSLNKNFKTGASIINIGSIYGHLAPNMKIYKNTKIFNSLSYSLSKAALNQFTRWFSSRFAPKFRANTISPGGILRKQEKKFISNYKSLTPLNRMGKEKDIVPLILFLLSDKSSYITGQNIIVDGGFSII